MRSSLLPYCLQTPRLKRLDQALQTQTKQPAHRLQTPSLDYRQRLSLGHRQIRCPQAYPPRLRRLLLRHRTLHPRKARDRFSVLAVIACN